MQKPLEKTEYIIIGISMVVILSIFWFVQPIAQDLRFHFFAGDDCNHTIPNFWNVSSNLVFVLIGFYGLYTGINYKLADWKYYLLSVSIVLTGIGSAYYHWSPNNQTLFWDRLPMTLVFACFFGAFYKVYFGKKKGNWATGILLSLGIFSVFYWKHTEINGSGDLRLYAIVQFLPLVILYLILLLKFKTSKTTIRSIIYITLFYAGAKICESYDHSIYHLFSEHISGHPIKHVLAGFACLVTIQFALKNEISLSK